MYLGECFINYFTTKIQKLILQNSIFSFINYFTTKIQKLILQNSIFKDVNIDKLLEYNVLVS